MEISTRIQPSRLLIFVLALFYLRIARGSIDFEEERKNYELKTLTPTKYSRLAALSDIKIFRKQLLDPMLIERVVDTEGHLETQQHIKHWMGDVFRWTIEEDSFTDKTPFGPKAFNNIIATLDPSAHRFLVLACHFDSKYFENIEFIGATDSAVPCAMLMDLARTLNYSLHNGKGSPAEHVSLQFIFLDGEEAFKHWTATDSIYGARHLAKRWHEQPHPHQQESNKLEGIDAILLLDLIGAANPTFHNMFDDTSHLFKRLSSIESKLHKAGVLENHPVPIQYFPSSQYFGRIEDDHIPFLNRGVPILHLICAPFPKVWHTKDDNAEALDYPTINNLNKIMRIFVSEYLHLKM